MAVKTKCVCMHLMQVVSDRDGQTYCLNHAVECLRSTPSAAANYKLFVRCEEVSGAYMLICKCTNVFKKQLKTLFVSVGF